MNTEFYWNDNYFQLFTYDIFLFPNSIICFVKSIVSTCFQRLTKFFLDMVIIAR